MSATFHYFGDAQFGGSPGTTATKSIGGTASSGDIIVVIAVGGSDGDGLGLPTVSDNLGSSGWTKFFDDDHATSTDEFRITAWQKLCVGGETDFTAVWPGSSNKGFEGIWMQSPGGGLNEAYVMGHDYEGNNPSGGHWNTDTFNPSSDGEIYIGFTGNGRDGYSYADLNINGSGADSGDGFDLGGAVKGILHHHSNSHTHLASDSVRYGVNDSLSHVTLGVIGVRGPERPTFVHGRHFEGGSGTATFQWKDDNSAVPAGALLVLLVSADQNTDFNVPSGFDQVGSQKHSANNNCRVAVFTRTANGSETGGTITTASGTAVISGNTRYYTGWPGFPLEEVTTGNVAAATDMSIAATADMSEDGQSLLACLGWNGSHWSSDGSTPTADGSGQTWATTVGGESWNGHSGGIMSTHDLTTGQAKTARPLADFDMAFGSFTAGDAAGMIVAMRNTSNAPGNLTVNSFDPNRVILFFGPGKTLQIFDPNANDADLSIDVVSNTVTVMLATGSDGHLTSTANDVIALLNGDGTITATLPPSSDGTGIVQSLVRDL